MGRALIACSSEDPPKSLLRLSFKHGFLGKVHIVANEMMSRKSEFDLSSFLPYQLAVLANRTSRNFSRHYSEAYGLSIPEWRVMAHLSQVSEVSVREIYERVEMDKSKVTRAAQRLEAIGLIRKVTNSKDKRLVALSLTQEGQSVMAKIVPLADGFAEAFLSALEPKERDVFQSAVRKLLDEDAKRVSGSEIG